MVKQYKAQMEEAGFTDKLVALTEEIEHLRSLLPADIDNEFLKEVENKLQKSKGNNIDWRDLQKSELFEAVMANQSIKTAPVEEDPKMLIWDFCILIS